MPRLRLVGVPAFALEQPFGFRDAPAGDGLADIRHHARDLVLGADLRRAFALVLGEDHVEAAVEGEEHAGRHAGEKHHPQHGILGHDADTLRIGLDDVALREQHDGGDSEQQRTGAGKPIEKLVV